MAKPSPLAGQPAPESLLVDVPRLVTAYYAERPDVSVPEQRVAFGTSGHRGSSLECAFNEAHILAISEAICRHRKQHGVDGPLFLGVDTHALSAPAFASALEVLGAHDVELMIDAHDGYTPTPAVSHAILSWNRGRREHLADGIVVTPSHNPPDSGGFKYNPPSGGPADTEVTRWIQDTANGLIADDLRGVARIAYAKALRACTTHRHDFLAAYVGDLEAVIDLAAIRDARVHVGADPLGGASVAYWAAIGERHGLTLEVVNRSVDATFRFMTVDWDGRIRMDCSSPYAMRRLVELKDRFDVAVANDTDADRHGIVTRSAGLLPPNHYLAVAIDYLYSHRPAWPVAAAVGKTIVSSSMIDRVAARLGRRLVEVPVGFKWFVGGLLEGSLAFGGEESAGGSFLRRDGSVWTTDKDGPIMCLLAAEIVARTGRDPGEHYRALAGDLGDPAYERIDAPATPAQKQALQALTPQQLAASELAGDKIEAVLTRAPGDGSPIGGVKVVTANGWFAARPSGTEEVYKVYAESFRGEAHLRRIQEEAQAMVAKALCAV